MDTTTGYTIFESDFRVRPDDIDMFQHVHNSKYFDYVLAARYEQMERFYGMSMEKFLKLGYGWVVRTAFVEYKRALKMGEYFKVRTGLLTIGEKGCRVQFEIINNQSNKVACDGWFDYIMIDINNGKSLKLTSDIILKYSI